MASKPSMSKAFNQFVELDAFTNTLATGNDLTNAICDVVPVATTVDTTTMTTTKIFPTSAASK